MKKIRLALILAMGFFGITRVHAQSSDLFSAHEASFDLFGFYGSRDKGGSSSSAAGPGVGFNYFFTQNFGIGADSYADAFTWPYLLNANGIFRYHIPGVCAAPYAFAGFGREWWHAPQWMGDVGGGIEYRPEHRNAGLFVDVRGVFPTETKDYAVVRFGIRFIFR
ncbi:MAG TPA: hypothetical protein VKV04_15420 [Verrucomicrobiae bacterium]|nr:hypothetical protein [Verrucomicrobiae bacterium]